jgi:uncharacterized protein (DUF1684 family)
MGGLIDMSTESEEEQQSWKAWREQRAETVSAPYGSLSLTGTYWLVDAVDGRIEGVPGHWAQTGDGDGVVLTAGPDDGLTVDGRPLDGAVPLIADTGPADASRLVHGERRLVVLHREGLWAVRIWDPAAGARLAFAGIEAFDYDPRWALPAVFRPYGEDRSVRVPNADGVERGLAVGGELAFTVGGTGHSLAVAVEPDGSLWGVIADGTSGTGSFRFRFIRPPAPAADGSVVLDLNRALLPPCAFADGFICPFPPPGNTLPFPVEAGERAVLTK